MFHMNLRETLFIENDELFVGKIKATDLAKRYGTPLYVMDGEYMLSVADEMVKGLSSYGDGAVAYASKAFASIATTKMLSAHGLWFDCVSGGELFLLLKAGANPKHIIAHGNAKTPKEIEEGVKAGIGLFAIDGISEISVLDEIARKYGVKQDVIVRINPLVSAHTYEAVQTSAPNSKFGFDVTKDAEFYIRDIISRENLNFKGLHVHVGSQIFDHSAYDECIEKVTDFVLKLKGEGIDVEILDLGGGYGVHYLADEPAFTAKRYGYTVKNIALNLSSALEKKGLQKPFLIVEPGRSIVGESGITLYTVTEIKDFPGVKKYVAVDGGMFENPRHALYGSEYSAIVANKAGKPFDDTVVIAGKCCESGDIISENVPLQTAEVGDTLAVFTTGAYNYSMASNYNLNPIPPVVLVMGDKADYIVKPQTYDDLVRNNVVPDFV